MTLCWCFEARLPGSQRIETAATSGSWILPRRTAMSSARIATAISSGLTAPMSRPTGALHALQALRGHAFGEQRVVDALDLRLAANQIRGNGDRGRRARAARRDRAYARASRSTT